MSLLSAANDEMQEVLNLLEGRPAEYRRGSAAPPPIRTASPAPAVRSMLDIDTGPPSVPRHNSIAGINTGITAPLRSAPLSGSMLNPYSPSLPASPRRASPSPSTHHRAMSEASSDRPKMDKGSLPFSDDQFDMSPTVSGQALPKRVKQGGRRGLSSMASIMQGQELDSVRMAGNPARHNSTAGIIGKRTSSSPSSRLNHRSQSPGVRLNNNSFNPLPMPGKFVSESGKVIDLNNAYRKLSDANLIKSGSSLSASASRARLDSGTTLSPSGELRLQKDVYDDDEIEGAIESSDEAKTSDEEAWGDRGRRRRRWKKGAGGVESEDSDEDGDKGSSKEQSKKKPTRVAQSLLHAAEDERKSEQV